MRIKADSSIVKYIFLFEFVVCFLLTFYLYYSANFMSHPTLGFSILFLGLLPSFILITNNFVKFYNPIVDFLIGDIGYGWDWIFVSIFIFFSVFGGHLIDIFFFNSDNSDRMFFSLLCMIVLGIISFFIARFSYLGLKKFEKIPYRSPVRRLLEINKVYLTDREKRLFIEELSPYLDRDVISKYSKIIFKYDISIRDLGDIMGDDILGEIGKKIRYPKNI